MQLSWCNVVIFYDVGDNTYVYIDVDIELDVDVVVG